MFLFFFYLQEQKDLLEFYTPNSVKSFDLSVTQADMLTQEANYKQIQDAKAMVEDDLQHKLEEFEEEREHLLKLANTASTLERDLEQVVMPMKWFILHLVCGVSFLLYLC